MHINSYLAKIPNICQKNNIKCYNEDELDEKITQNTILHIICNNDKTHTWSTRVEILVKGKGAICRKCFKLKQSNAGAKIIARIQKIVQKCNMTYVIEKYVDIEKTIVELICNVNNEHKWTLTSRTILKNDKIICRQCNPLVQQSQLDAQQKNIDIMTKIAKKNNTTFIINEYTTRKKTKVHFTCGRNKKHTWTVYLRSVIEYSGAVCKKCFPVKPKKKRKK